MRDSPVFFAHARTAMVHGLRLCNISKDDVVLIPDYSCSVVPQSISNVCSYVYYTVNNDFTPDWRQLHELVGNKTKAIMMVHYFGQAKDVEKFINFAREYSLLLIEDNSSVSSSKISLSISSVLSEETPSDISWFSESSSIEAAFSEGSGDSVSSCEISKDGIEIKTIITTNVNNDFFIFLSSVV